MSDPLAGQQLSTTNAFTVLRSQTPNFLKQIEAAAAVSPDGNTKVSDLPSIVWRTRRFVLEAHLDRKRSRGRRSWITKYGDFLGELEGSETVKSVVWSCKACARRNKPQFFIAQSTSSSIRHLLEEHSIREHSDDQEASLTVLELQGMALIKRPAGSTMTKAQSTLIHDLAIGYIHKLESALLYVRRSIPESPTLPIR